MDKETVALLGNSLAERLPLHDLAREFGWSFEVFSNIHELRKAVCEREITTVLFDAQSEPLEKVLEAAPNAFPIVCHPPSQPIQWSELAEHGAFHALLTPLQTQEVRQSLGFVEARRRSSPTSLPLSFAAGR